MQTIPDLKLELLKINFVFFCCMLDDLVTPVTLRWSSCVVDLHFGSSKQAKQPSNCYSVDSNSHAFEITLPSCHQCGKRAHVNFATCIYRSL